MRGHWIAAFVLVAIWAAPAHADDQSQANQLFVDAAKMADQADGEESAADRANLYAMAAARLNSIVQLYPASDIAAALVARGHYGRIDLEMIEAQAAIARLEVQLAARSDDPASADALAEIDALKAENAELMAELGAAIPAASIGGDDALQELTDRNTSLDAEIVSLAAVIAALRAENARLAEALAYEEERYTSLILAQTDVGDAAAPAEAAPETQVAAAPAAAPESAAPLTDDDIIAGLRDALRVGTETVVGQLGATDGFNADPKIHIPLPASMKQVTDALQMIGMTGLTEDLELKINRAAEDATPAAKDLFWQAITDLSIDDIEGIFNGPDDAATQYFKAAMSDPLGDAMRPIIDRSLAEVGAVQAFDGMMGKYQSIPFVPDVKADLTEHTLAAAMDGIFYYLGEEEAAIRNDEVKRTTELLQRVFADQ